MKKVTTMLVMLVVAMTMSAQVGGVKIAPKYQKGDNMLYRSEATMDLGGQTVTVTSDSRFVVTEASPSGYTIEVTTDNVSSDAKDLMGRIMTMTQGLMSGAKIVYAADADGKVTAIKNYAEVKALGEKAMSRMFDEMLEEMPDMAQMLPVDMLKEQVAEQLTEDKLLAAVARTASPLSLNGKTIATGAMEESTDEDGRKVKNMYFLGSPDGKQVKVTTTLNMSKEEMKQMIIEQVKKLAPDQAEMIEQNIDLIMQSGQMKFEMNQTADYTFGNNGWAKTITTSQSQSMMGQATSGTSKMELVESSR